MPGELFGPDCCALQFRQAAPGWLSPLILTNKPRWMASSTRGRWRGTAGTRAPAAVAPHPRWPAASLSAAATGRTTPVPCLPVPRRARPPGSLGQPGLCSCCAPRPAGPRAALPPLAWVPTPGNILEAGALLPSHTVPTPAPLPVQTLLRDPGAPCWVSPSWSPLALDPPSLAGGMPAGPPPRILCPWGPSFARSLGSRVPSRGTEPTMRWGRRLPELWTSGH